MTAGGESAAAGPVTATPRTVPGAPTALTAVPGNGSVTMSWAPPADSGGSPVIGYRLYRDNSLIDELDAAITTFADTDLVNGTAHAYTVTAVTAGGESAPAGPAAATPRTVPGAPTALAVAPGAGDILELTWSPPAGDGGAPVTAYEVRRDGAIAAIVATPGWTDPDPGCRRGPGLRGGGPQRRR